MNRRFDRNRRLALRLLRGSLLVHSMHNRRLNQLWPTAALAVVCAALGAAWVVEPSLAPEGMVGRLTVLVCAMLLALVAVRIAFLQAAKTAQAARVHIDYL